MAPSSFDFCARSWLRSRFPVICCSAIPVSTAPPMGGVIVGRRRGCANFASHCGPPARLCLTGSAHCRLANSSGYRSGLGIARLATMERAPGDGKVTCRKRECAQRAANRSGHSPSQQFEFIWISSADHPPTGETRAKGRGFRSCHRYRVMDSSFSCLYVHGSLTA